MVHVYNQEQKSDAARKIAEITGISDDGMNHYDESHPFIGNRNGSRSGSYGFKGKSDITIEYEDFIKMIEDYDDSPDSSAILNLL